MRIKFVILSMFLVSCLFSQNDLLPVDTFNSFVIKLKDYEKKYAQNQGDFKKEIQQDLINELNGLVSEEPELIKNYLKIESYPYQWSMSKIYSLSGNKKLTKRHWKKFQELRPEDLTSVPAIYRSISTSSKINSNNNSAETKNKRGFFGRMFGMFDFLKADDYDYNYVEGLRMDVITIDSDHISKMPANSVADVLEYIMGVNVYKRGSIDANASLTTMGGTSNQTLILVDGFDIRPENTMYSNLDFPFSIYDIDKIEVFQGAASRKYSSKAISAVINIITKVADSQESNFNAKGGSGPINVNVVSHIKTDHSNHVLSLTNLTATGLQDNDSTLAMSAYYKYFVENGRNKTHLSFGYLDKANGNSTIYRATTNQSRFLNGKVQWGFDDKTLESNFHWNNSIYQLAPYEIVEAQPGSCAGGTAVGTEDEAACQTLIDGGDAAVVWTSAIAAIQADSSEVTNLGYGFKGILYNKHGGLSTYRIDVAMEEDDSNKERIQYTLAYDIELTKGFWQINGGISYTEYSGVASTFANGQGRHYTSSGLDLNYNFSDNTRIYGSMNKGFRVPSFEELYGNTFDYKGSEALTAELHDFYEYGIQINNHRLDMNFGMFFNRGYNTIDWMWDATNNVWQAANITNASDPDNETYGKYPSTFINGHKINVDFLNHTFEQVSMLNGFSRLSLSYVFTDVELDTDKTYRYLSNYFRHQAILNMEFKLPFKMHQSLIIRYEEPIKDLAESEDYGWLKVDAQTSFDLMLIKWKFDGTLAIKNLTGTNYYDEQIYVDDSNQPVSLPGTSVQVGFKYNF